MKKFMCGLSALVVASASASVPYTPLNPTIQPLPVACIGTQFSATGSQYWKTVTLTVKNNCGKPVDFQDATIKFASKTALSADFHGTFTPLPYPNGSTKITSSEDKTNNQFIATLSLHFPEWHGSSTMLPAGKSFTIIYGTPKDERVGNSAEVYLGTAPSTGTLSLKNAAKPNNVNQNYAVVHITMNGQVVKDVQLNWGASLDVTGLAIGSYTISPESITDTNGNTYQGAANPTTVSVAENKTVSSAISYSLVQKTGKVSIKVSSLPSELNGYTTEPTVLLTQTTTGASVSQAVGWNKTTDVAQLKAGDTYKFSTAVINHNDAICTGTFSPATAVANATTAPVVNLSYKCVKVEPASVTLNVVGAPATLTTLNVTLTPNDNSTPVKKTINLTNGAGSEMLGLVEGKIYTISADNVAGYSVKFSHQPLTAAANLVETITFTEIASGSGGRIITYVPGWKPTPAAADLAGAGYTHVMVAFGLFSTTTPGVIVPGFDTITKEYIQSLHNVGIKVILSLGGALTEVANTTVDFHQVLSAAASPEAFQQTFINSLNGLMKEYNFDGFDIDIEHGINAGGTFTQPQGDIAVLANIINTMYRQNPSLLITLTPQVANISATSGFNQTWGNYAALAAQTHESLAWVGIQLYNTGCAYGIDLICYPDSATTPDFSVAMATDLLENWPARTADGRATGFQPYISYLKPSQVVLGYPAPNASGDSDGRPAKPNKVIKRALQCLRTAVKGSDSCDTYVPPRAYGQIGGVFNWEATYDQANGFNFAKELRDCVMNGNCQ